MRMGGWLIMNMSLLGSRGQGSWPPEDGGRGVKCGAVLLALMGSVHPILSFQSSMQLQSKPACLVARLFPDKWTFALHGLLACTVVCAHVGTIPTTIAPILGG